MSNQAAVPTEIVDHLAQAKALFVQAQYAEAAAACRNALGAGQRVQEALALLGSIASLSKAKPEALVLLRLALSLAPKDVSTINAYGLALRESKRFAEARQQFELALSLAPNHSQILRNLGHTYYAEHKWEDAERVFAQAFAGMAMEGKDYVARGWTLMKLKRHAAALDVFDAFTKAAPGSAEAWYGLANARYELGMAREAIATYRQAIKVNPSYMLPYLNLGALFVRHGNRAAAVRVSRDGLKINAKHSQLYMNLGVAQGAGGMAAEAVAAFRRTEELENGNSKAGSNRLFYIQYLSDLTPRGLYEAHRDWAIRYTAGIKRLPARRPEPAAGRKLRIGYVSPDFRSHSCAWFLQSLYDHHDRDRVEIFSYANVDWPDRITESFRQRSDQWRDIENKSAHDVAQIITNDKVDVLIDLAGHTARNSLLAFAHKPAPVQATWLGYPTTTGLDTIDYRISDMWLTPPDTAELFTESIFHLDRLSHCFRPVAEAPEVNPLPFDSAGHITFGSFNNFAKLSDDTMRLWAKILAAIPNAKLLLKSRFMADEEAQGWLNDRFEKAGMDLSRVEFTTGTDNKLSHLKVYHRVDVGLDCFPYGGMTTSCEALWMGVPVLTRTGWRGASRYGTSLLNAVGLPDYVADTDEALVQAAVRVTSDISRLREVRAGLRARMAASEICDAPGFARAMEAAYFEMWERCCASWRD